MSPIKVFPEHRASPLMVLRTAVTIFVFCVWAAAELAAAPITIIGEGTLMMTRGSDDVSLDGAHLRIVYNLDDQTTPSGTTSQPPFYEQIWFDSLPVQIEISNRPDGAGDLSLQKPGMLTVENGYSISSLGDFVAFSVSFDDEPFLNGSQFVAPWSFEFRPMDVFPGTTPPELAQLVGVESTFFNFFGAGNSSYDINANFSAVSAVPEPNALVAVCSLSLIGLIARAARRRRQAGSVTPREPSSSR